VQRTFGLALMLLLCPAWTGTAGAGSRFPEATGYVSDFAQVLDSGAQARLENALNLIDERYEVQIAIATVKDLQGEDPTTYANLLFEAWHVGNKKTNRGLLLLYVDGEPGKRYFKVETGYGLEGVLPDGKVGAIKNEEVIPYLREGQIGLGLTAAVRGLMGPVLEEQGKDPSELNNLLGGGGAQRSRRATRQQDRKSVV
jgi:uncharacterized protein